MLEAAAPSWLGDLEIQHYLALPAGKGATQNMVTCLYQAHLAGLSRHVRVMWIKHVMGQGLCVSIDDPSCQYTCKVRMKPWYFFWRKQGSKSFELCDSKVEVFWDLSSAKFTYGPEPHQGFYVAVVFDEEMVLLLGDKCKEAYKESKARPSAITPRLISRKEHVFGKRYFCTKARFDESGKAHDIVIECRTHGSSKEPYLLIKIDRQLVLQVTKLAWKFRGNQTVLINGSPLEIFWDVLNWVFNPGAGNAVFIFQSGNIACGKHFCSKDFANTAEWSGELNGRISAMKLLGTRSLKSARELGHAGFSLMLHAWKRE